MALRGRDLEHETAEDDERRILPVRETGVPFPPGTVLLGKYRVERVLGRGGMGVVVAALNLDLEQPVALKFLLAESERPKSSLERFTREARAASKLRSEHAARVMDVGKLATGEPYIVMELLEGRDLKELLVDEGPMPVASAVDYVLQAIDAVAEAHQLGIVHRDLKPSNLFLANRPAGEPIIKLLDFGISKMLDPLDESGDRVAITATTAFLGSPAYMSPEQCRSPRDVDVRTDIWSLGAILYELITERRPFPGASEAMVLAAVLERDPAPMRAVIPTVPAELEEAILRCLRKAPEQRFETVADLALAIAPFGTGQAIRNVERAVRLLRRESVPALARTSGSGERPRVSPDVAGTGTLRSAGVSASPYAAPAPHVKASHRFVIGGLAVLILAVLVAGLVALRRGGRGAGEAHEARTAQAETASATVPASPASPASPPPQAPTLAAPDLAHSAPSAGASSAPAPAHSAPSPARARPRNTGVRPSASAKPASSIGSLLDTRQ